MIAMLKDPFVLFLHDFKKSSFGQETIPKIISRGDISLDKITVTGMLESDGSLIAINANIGKIFVKGSATIASSICNAEACISGSLTAMLIQGKVFTVGGSISMFCSNITNKINTGGSLTATQCDQIGTINAEGSVHLHQCPSVQSISTEGHVTLQDTVVQGDVFSGSDATVETSKVNETLTCASEKLVINESEIDTINLRCPNNNITTEDITIKEIYLKEVFKKISDKEQENNPRQTLELYNSKVKNVIFESGNGQVILFGNSCVTGEIIGGKLCNG